MKMGTERIFELERRGLNLYRHALVDSAAADKTVERIPVSTKTHGSPGEYNTARAS